MSTKIEYLDETVNPIRTKEGGWYCEKVSTGCSNCFAEIINLRFGDKKSYKKRNVELILNHDALNKISKWKKPKRIFVQDMSDLFLSKVTDSNLIYMFSEIFKAPQHTYLFLTKHPQRMKEFLGTWEVQPNIWLGVSVENQEQADKRIPILLNIPAAVRFVSCEPLLSPIDLEPFIEGTCLCCYGTGRGKPNKNCEYCNGTGEGNKLNWIIIGAESGPGARKIDNLAIHTLLTQCTEAHIPVFLKQAWVRGKLVKMPIFNGQVWDQMPRRIK